MKKLPLAYNDCIGCGPSQSPKHDSDKDADTGNKGLRSGVRGARENDPRSDIEK